MAGSEEYLDFTVHIANNAEDLKNDVFESIDVRCAEGQVLKIGRATKSELAISSAGVSWVHAELRLLPKSDGEAEGQRQLGIRDISSNGTGLQLPGAELVRLTKGEDTPVPNGATLALPMRLKAAEDQRFFSVHLGADASEAAAPSGDAEAAGKPAEEVAAHVVDRAAQSGVCDIDSDSPAAAPAKRRSPEHEAEPEAVDEPVSGNNFESLPANMVDAGTAGEEAADEPAPKKRRRSLPKPDHSTPSQHDQAWASQAFADASAGLPPARPPSGPPGVRPPPRGARPKAAAAAARAAASSNVPPELREKIQEGEAIIRLAREAEDRNQWGQAFDCYQRGLAQFMEVLPKLGKDSAGGINLRQQINGYLTRAGELKEKLERSKVFGCRKLVRPRGAGPSVQ